MLSTEELFILQRHGSAGLATGVIDNIEVSTFITMYLSPT